jgi:hypothetical protein
MYRPGVIEVIAFDIVIHAGIPILVMWIAGRLFGPRTAMAVGLLAAAFVLYMIVGIYQHCNAEPICYPPGNMENCTFPCDAPVGWMLHTFVRYGGPISVALLVAATSFQYWQFRRQRQS